MRGKSGEVGAEEGSEGHRKQLAEGQTPLSVAESAPGVWGVGVCSPSAPDWSVYLVLSFTSFLSG